MSFESRIDMYLDRIEQVLDQQNHVIDVAQHFAIALQQNSELLIGILTALAPFRIQSKHSGVSGDG